MNKEVTTDLVLAIASALLLEQQEAGGSHGALRYVASIDSAGTTISAGCFSEEEEEDNHG